MPAAPAMLSRFGREALLSSGTGDGWITLRGVHIHIGDDGNIDKGPAHLVGKSPDHPDVTGEPAAKGGKSAAESPAFKAWFGDSKVVDEDGKPLVVYHGTKAAFREFNIKKFGASDEGLVGKGFYFTHNPEEASGYAENEQWGRGDQPNVIPAYVALKNPFIITHGVLPDGRTIRQAHGGPINAKAGDAIR